MKSGRSIYEQYQCRMVLCGHKAVEAGAVCLVLMVQGNLACMTLTHLAIASRAETFLLPEIAPESAESAPSEGADSQ